MLQSSYEEANQSAVKSMGRKPEGVLLDRSNLRQYIDFLKETFPKLTQKSIAKIAYMQPVRLYNLLSNENCNKYIRPEEIAGLRRVYDDLESGNVIYIPDQRGRCRKKKAA